MSRTARSPKPASSRSTPCPRRRRARQGRASPRRSWGRGRPPIGDGVPRPRLSLGLYSLFAVAPPVRSAPPALLLRQARDLSPAVGHVGKRQAERRPGPVDAGHDAAQRLVEAPRRRIVAKDPDRGGAPALPQKMA